MDWYNKPINGRWISVICLVVSVIIASCEKEEKDTELPVIDMTGANHFPQNCDTVYIGEAFRFSARFTDNFELGSYSIDIHHNFDHHSHSTEMSDCPMDPVKTPANPFLFIEQFDIPEGKTGYQAEQEIMVPEGVDDGDYHLMVRLTDKTGWQAIRGISIKLAVRP
ncbi:MAG: DUF4625 domain-containing protein [Marinilabiliales bacterium]|nr:MAG: DUF4625 domain-containing protein [Marinilabiliales bacterium]